MGLDYAREKLERVVDDLADDDGDLRERLKDAWCDHMLNVHADDVPDDERDRFERLYTTMTNMPAAGSEGTIAASAWLLTVEEAATVEREIVELYKAVSRATGS